MLRWVIVYCNLVPVWSASDCNSHVANKLVQHLFWSIFSCVSAQTHPEPIPIALTNPYRSPWRGSRSVEAVARVTTRCTEFLGTVRYGLNTLPNTPVQFGAISIPGVPDTLVKSVRPLCRCPALRYVWYDLNTCTGHLGECIPGDINPTKMVRYGLNILPDTPV